MKKGLLSLYCLSSILTASSQTSATHTFHANPEHTGVYESAVNAGNMLTEKWKFKTSGKIFSSPCIYKNTIFIGSEDGNLYAIDKKTGIQKWKFKTTGAVYSSPTINKNTVYFGSLDGYYYAVDITTGKQKWKFNTGGEKMIGGKGYGGMKPADLYMTDLWDYFISSPVVDTNAGDEIVYFGSSTGNVYAVSGKDGTLLWKFSTHGIIHTTPALHNGILYIGSWDNYLYAIDAKTGIEKWKFKTGDVAPMSGIQASVTIYEDKVYFGARDAFFYALNAKTGDLVWKYSAEGSWILSTAAVKDNKLYVGSSDTYLLLTLDAGTGKELGRFKTCGYVYSSPAINNDKVFFGDFTGKFYMLDPGNNKAVEFTTADRNRYAKDILKNDTLNFMYASKGSDLSYYLPNKKVMDDFYKLGPIVSSPVIEDGVVYFGSANGYLYALFFTKNK